MRKFLRAFMMVLLMLSALCAASVQASAMTLDGLEIKIETDKGEYSPNEAISVTATITNKNDITVKNVRLEAVVPEGYELNTGSYSVGETAALAPGKKFVLSYTLNSLTAETKGGWVKFLLIGLGGVAVVGAIAVVAIFIVRSAKKKKAVTALSLLLCFAMLGAMAAPIQASAAEQSTLNLTHDVKVGKNTLSLNANLNYDKIIGEKMNLSVDGEGMLYDKTADRYHLIKKLDSLKGTLLYTDEVKEAKCVVTDVNGKVLFENTFEPKNMWSVGDIGFVVGENNVCVSVDYQNGVHHEVSFDINNVCEENMDGLDVDKGDTDKDGVLNFIEDIHGTDKTKADSDGDGIDDYYEIAVFGTDPLKVDFDGNGVSDADEDADNDGLTNVKEINEYSTNPIMVDSDGDGLSDKDEIDEYKTDPTVADTDEDGKDDGWEISNGYDPLEATTDFPLEEDSDASPDYVSAESDGDVVITELTDDFLLNKESVGYIGVNPVDIQLKDGNSADITIEYDSDMLPEGEDPSLYLFEDETQSYEYVESVAENGKVKATIHKSGKYILLDHRHVGEVWENDIFRPSQTEDGAIDMVFVIDRSSSMSDNDPQSIRKDVTKEFINKLRMDKDRAGVVQFSAESSIVYDMSNDANALCVAVDEIHNSDGCDSDAGTNGSAGLRSALNMLEGSVAKYKYIIFLTDGKDTTVSEDYGDAEGTYGITGEARSKGIVIHTIGLIGTGEMDIDLLKRVAAGTGGNYYPATLSEDGAEKDSQEEKLEDIYDQVESVTIDRHLDSNDDGISDYYTRLICEGKMGTATGMDRLFGEYTYEEIQKNADLDGDGIKNGDELKIIETEQGVFVRIISLPYTKDSDKDGLLDLEEHEGVTNPLKKNGNVNVDDVAWLINSENFWADEYMDFYNGCALERGAVWIGNAFFGTTLDQTNLYRDVLSEYFVQIDEQIMEPAVNATYNEFIENVFSAIFSDIEEYIITAAEKDGLTEAPEDSVDGETSDDEISYDEEVSNDESADEEEDGGLEAELAQIKDFLDDVSDYYSLVDDTSALIGGNEDALSDAIKKLVTLSDDWNLTECKKEIQRLEEHMSAIAKGSTDATREYKIARLNELTAEYTEYRAKKGDLEVKIETKSGFVDKIGKGLDVLDKALFVIDVAQDSWDAYMDYCDMISALDTLEKNVYILDNIISVTGNMYLWSAAIDMKMYVSDYINEDVRRTIIALNETEEVVTSATLEIIHGVIGELGYVGMAIELVRSFGNVVFNLDDASEFAAKTVAMASTSDILAKNYKAHLEGMGAVKNGNQWIAYADYSDQMYVCFLNLAMARMMGEDMMMEWQDNSTITEGCKDNIDKCKGFIKKYTFNYFCVFLDD